MTEDEKKIAEAIRRSVDVRLPEDFADRLVPSSAFARGRRTRVIVAFWAGGWRVSFSSPRL